MAGEKLPKEWLDFAKELKIRLPAGKAIAFGQNLFWAPEELPDIRRLKIMRPGLELGEVKKGRFEPAHHLALWLQEGANSVSFPAESDEIREYMHGNVIPGSVKGWCLIKVDGYSLGWAKGDGKQLKNHYPKGLRR
jgi:NOL1/NOP2/fmu family ribosome biogenesis protein